MNALVKIPPTPNDSRIGSVFGNVIQVLYSTEQTDFKHVGQIVWDFSECSNLHPIFLAALSLLVYRFGDKIQIVGISDELDELFKRINFTNPLEINQNETLNIGRLYANKTYTPICRFNPNLENESDKAQSFIKESLRNQIGPHTNLYTTLSYFMGELVDNISDHSASESAFIHSQYVSQEGIIYLFIADMGKSIYTSFATDERYASLLTPDESSALSLALDGKSTKNRPETENRGYGISTTCRIVVEILGGAFYIISGGVFFGYEQGNDCPIVDLPEDLQWDGTAILLKIPTRLPDDFNIYKYIS